MLYTYDTEFLENGKTIKLISIGVVAEDGREYYAVNSDAPWQKIFENDWLLRNVVTQLPLVNPESLNTYVNSPPYVWSKSFLRLQIDQDDPSVKPAWVIRNELLQFFSEGGSVELWADYGAYDHVLLMQLWGRMIDKPAILPYYTNDLQQLIGNDIAPMERIELPAQEEGEHNALADARHVMKCLRLLGLVG